MAVQAGNQQASQFEVSNPTLLQQALNQHELRSHDGTLATMQAESNKEVRKSRKMRELATTFQPPQIEITHATIIRRILDKVSSMDPEAQANYANNLGTSFFGADWQKRKGGNVFLELALMQEKSMSGNQAATIGRLSQEQADQNQMANMNTNLAHQAQHMEVEAHKAYEAEKRAEADRHHGFWGIFAGIAAIVAIVVVAVVVGVCTDGVGDAALLPELGEAAEAGEGLADAGDAAGGLSDTGDASTSADAGEGSGGGDVDGDADGVSNDAGSEGADSTSETSEDNATQEARQSESNFKQVWEKCASKLKGSIGRGFRQLFSDWRIGLPVGAGLAGGIGSVTYGAYSQVKAQDAAANATADGGYISADATSSQIFSNDINIFNQDISMQSTDLQQLNDSNSSAAAFVKTAAQDMQQVQSLGNMF